VQQVVDKSMSARLQLVILKCNNNAEHWQIGKYQKP
jgi:hypothetical protein